MNKEYIKKALRHNIPKIDIYDSLESTNTLMKEEAKKGAKEFSVIIASMQSNGRGRMGRSFFSPCGSGLYMSILLRPKKDINPLYITPFAAVAVSNAFERISGKSAQIKWVNDIYVDNRKVCGILTEASLGENGYSVLGIGVNVFMPDGGFPDDIKMRAGALFEKEEEYIREKVATLIINEFIDIYKAFDKEKMLSEYTKRSLVLGKEIDIIENGKTETATAISVDDEFSLIVKKEDGMLYTLNSGDVSIKI